MCHLLIRIRVLTLLRVRLIAFCLAIQLTATRIFVNVRTSIQVILFIPEQTRLMTIRTFGVENTARIVVQHVRTHIAIRNAFCKHGKVITLVPEELQNRTHLDLA